MSMPAKMTRYLVLDGELFTVGQAFSGQGKYPGPSRH